MLKKFLLYYLALAQAMAHIAPVLTELNKTSLWSSFRDERSYGVKTSRQHQAHGLNPHRLDSEVSLSSVKNSPFKRARLRQVI